MLHEQSGQCLPPEQAKSVVFENTSQYLLLVESSDNTN